MRVILDTNVFVSGVFFSGPPARILEAWRDHRLALVLSSDIFAEYQRVGQLLAEQYRGADLDPLLILLATHGEWIEAPPLRSPVSVDPDDDKFLACAAAGHVQTIVSGDKHLLTVSGWQGIQVVRPRHFLDESLGPPER